MKIMYVWLLVVAFYMARGLHADVSGLGFLFKAKTATNSFSWSMPVGNSCNVVSPCTWIVSRATVSAKACPVTTSNYYTPLNQNSPLTVMQFSQKVSATSNECYIVQTKQGNGISAPSGIKSFFRSR